MQAVVSLAQQRQSPPVNTPTPLAPAPVTHYENFPVASLLCPPGLRQPVAAIYAFARTADDIADEGEATAGERLSDLAAYRAELRAAAAGQAPGARWAGVFCMRWGLRSACCCSPCR